VTKKIADAYDDQFIPWHYERKPEEPYVDISLEFTRPLTPHEHHRAVAHFVNGLDRLEVTKNYVIRRINFSKQGKLKMTFSHIEVDETQALLQLLIEFRKEFPVKPPKPLYDLESGKRIPYQFDD
jgi:hypothetical protein